MRLLPSLQRLILGAGGGLGLTFLFLGHPSPPAAEVGELPPVYAEPAERMEVRTLASGQTLGQLMTPALDHAEQQAALMAFQELASPRRLAAGIEVTFRQRSADGWIRGLDVAINADSTVRLTRDEFGWHSSVILTPLWTDTVFAAGSIEGSLWASVVDNAMLEEMPAGDRVNLLITLEDVFKWQIDFTRQIQKGDRYRFAIERKVRPDGSMQSGRIVAADFATSGKTLDAIWFDAEGDGKGSYYDREGNSLRRAFLARPLEFRRISSRFSSGRLHPVLGTWRAHRGVDYAASTGTPVQATADGRIVHRGVSGGYGNMVEVQHANAYSTRYAHLSRFQSGLSVGSYVRQGDVIGFVGATGLATGPHLHYEMLQRGRQIDPLSLNVPSGDPVPAHALDRWTREMYDRLALLDALPGANGVRYATGAPAPPPADPLRSLPAPTAGGGGR